VEGANKEKVPLVNCLVDALTGSHALEDGVLFWLVNAVLETGQTPQRIAEQVGEKSLDLARLPRHERGEIDTLARRMAEEALTRLFALRTQRQRFQDALSPSAKPWLYVIVATGNIYDDIEQAKAAAEQGADAVAVIRSTAQSLLDYVPEGVTTEGFGGTFATQANFRLMRIALDEVSQSSNRYVRQVNYCSGLCMAEIAALGILEGLDILVNDALYGILFRDLNMVRTMVDQHFSRYLLGLFDTIIVTGEDNLIKTIDAYQEYQIVLVSQFINEQLAKRAGMREELIGLGHAAELDPSLPDSLLWELVQAQLVRQLFPRSPVKFMPPTRYKTGNIFFAHVLDTLFNLVSVWTEQEIVLLGMPTEAIHTPYIQDRFLSLESALHVRRAAASIGRELRFKPNGVATERAESLLVKTEEALAKIAKHGLWSALASGDFSHIKRTRKGGRGYEGVFRKGDFYLNPFLDPLLVRNARRKVA
jgi:beta-lysine 5,6-aminomutase alpha subunit